VARTCDSHVAGSSPGWVPPRSGLGQDTYTPVCLCHQAVLFGTGQGAVMLFG